MLDRAVRSGLRHCLNKAMKKIKVTAIVVALLALAAVSVWRYVQAKQLTAVTTALREQVEEATVLREENRHLAEQLQAASQRSQAESSELLRLRGQSGRLRQVEQDNNRLRAEGERLAKSQSSTTDPQEGETAESKLQRAKGFFGRDLGLALRSAADANGGNVPSDFHGPLFEMVERLSEGAAYDIQAKHFESVYRGSLGDIKDISATVLAREKQAVRRPDGQWVRLYVLADGSSQYISASTPEALVAREQELWPDQFRK
jgi:Tfp pilus assembly protein PilE